MCCENCYLRIDAEFEASRGHRFLYTLAVGRIAGCIPASFIIIDQTTDLIGGSTGVLFASAEPIHFDSNNKLLLFRI